MDGYGKRILVIGDEDGCQAHLKTLLEQEGYAVQIACDGLAGIDEMRKRRFAVVIADCHRPGLNGIEFAEFSGIARPDTPIILVSSDSNNLTKNAEEYGAMACIRKPYESTLLLSLLRTAARPVLAIQAAFPMTDMEH